MRLHWWRRSVVLVIIFTSACASIPRPGFLKEHVLQFDRKGDALDPTKKNLPNLTEDGFAQYLNGMFTALKTQQSVKRRVLLFIHGGLNTTDAAIKRANDLTAEVTTHGGYFPIFINWDASLTRAYGTHLVHLRQGAYVNNWYLTPFLFIGDAFRSVGRLPLDWFLMLKNDSEAQSLASNDLQLNANEIYCALRTRYENNPADYPAISKGINGARTGERIKSRAAYAATLLTKLVTVSIVDGAGTESWNVMLRNTELLFRKDATCIAGCVAKDDGVQESASKGDLARFLDRLEMEIADAPPEVTWDISVIGHSMGALVVNRMLRRSKVHFTNIVYMAAACSVDDYEESVFPYLEDNPTTHMYHLVLHDLAEVRDSSASAFGPRGSLLVWIDNFLSQPLTLRQRTAGRFENLVRALPDTPYNLWSQISVKTFANGKKFEQTDPQRHGDFTKVKAKDAGGEFFSFYSPEFWTPTAPNTPDPCCGPHPDVRACGRHGRK